MRASLVFLMAARLSCCSGLPSLVWHSSAASWFKRKRPGLEPFQARGQGIKSLPFVFLASQFIRILLLSRVMTLVGQSRKPRALATAAPSGKSRAGVGDLLICLVLAVVTAAVYVQVRHHQFINLDDPYYVTENAQVSRSEEHTSELQSL